MTDSIVTRRGFAGILDADGEWSPLPILGGDGVTDLMETAGEYLSPEQQSRLVEGVFEHYKNADDLEDRKLAQQMSIAQLGERGANSRASTAAGASRYAANASAGASRYAANASAGASRYASDASVKNAKLAAETQRYGIDTSRLTDQEKIALDRQLGLGGLGVDLVKTAASLTGPEDVFKYVDLIRGGRGLGGAPYFLGALTGAGTGGGQIAGYQAPGGTPTPLTMDSLLKGLGAGGAGGVTSNGSMTDMERSADAFKQNLGSLLAGGIHKFQPGSLERLNPSELGLLQGAAGKLGYNFDDLMATYQRAGIGQGNASAA